jgi:hypothetical protein
MDAALEDGLNMAYRITGNLNDAIVIVGNGHRAQKPRSFDFTARQCATQKASSKY